MAKFRKNHSSNSSNRRGESSAKKTVFRYVFWFVGILVFLKVLSSMDSLSWDAPTSSSSSDTYQGVVMTEENGNSVKKSFLPESTTGMVVHHDNYTLSYSEEHEQAEWVAYKLTEENLRKPNVKRAKRFNPDHKINTRSAYHKDYSHSGYTRGHLAPAGDMAHSIEAMQQSFYMSNMSPQLREFNGGIWRELEENVRDWAFDNDELYIVSGPVLNDGHIIKKIGKNKVSVPDLFYKIILDNKGRDKKAIAFLIPNEKSTKSLKSYVVNIDDIEELIGIDFFADFLDPALESELEASSNANDWKFDRKRFEKRVRSWNNR